MTNLLDVNVGYVGNKQYLEAVEENGVTTIKGAQAYENIYKHLSEWSLNVSYTKHDKFGDYVNGSYTGLFGMLQEKEIDIVTQTFPLNVKRNLFTYTAALGEFRHVIHSITQAPKNITVELISSLNSLDSKSYALLFSSILLYYLIMKLSKLNVCVIYFMEIFFHQNFRQFYQARMRMTSFVLGVGFFFVYFLEIANFNTQLSVVILPPKIDDLEDIIKWDIRPCFYDFTGTHEYFQYGTTKEAAAVWNIAIRKGIHKSLFSMGEIQVNLKNSGEYFSGKAVKISPHFMYEASVALFCACFSEEVELRLQRNQMIHMSEPLFNSIVSFPIRHGLLFELRRRLDQVSYNFIEQGFLAHFWKKLAHESITSIARKDHTVCEAKLELYAKNIAANAYEPIILRHIAMTLFGYFLVMTGACTLVVWEIFFNFIARRRKVRNKIFLRRQE